MVDTRLVLLEGLAGTGKSTLGQILCGMITQAGLPAEFVHEFDKRNPVHVGPAVGGEGWQDAVRDKWQQFIRQAGTENRPITIMDAAFLQCPVSELLERGVETRLIHSFVEQIRDLLLPLRPVIIYLYQQNIESALQTTFAGRNGKWQQKVITFLVDTPFARRHTQSGFDLYLELNRQTRQICDEIVGKIPFRVLQVDTSGPNWPVIHRQVAENLGIRHNPGQ